MVSIIIFVLGVNSINHVTKYPGVPVKVRHNPVYGVHHGDLGILSTTSVLCRINPLKCGLARPVRFPLPFLQARPDESVRTGGTVRPSRTEGVIINHFLSKKKTSQHIIMNLKDNNDKQRPII